MAELNLWLDSYDDIYADFDSRHYLKRRISEDFLHEIRTEMKYKEHHTGDMVLLLPQKRRDESVGKIIADSLTDFFTSQFRFHHDKCRKKLNKGILLFVTGVIIMLLNSWVSYYSKQSFLIIGLKVLLEPAGWFLLWAALNFLVYDFAELKKERNFYKELRKCIFILNFPETSITGVLTNIRIIADEHSYHGFLATIPLHMKSIK